MGPEKNGVAGPGWERLCDLVAEALALEPCERDASLRSANVAPELRQEAASLIAAAVADDSKAQMLDRGLPDLDGLAATLVEDPADMRWVGRHLGAYIVERVLGHGGMGLVLLARRADTLYERTVAIKVIQATLEREEFTRRFRRETRILARLQHPAIVSLLDAGTTEEDRPYFVMEYVDGLPIHVYAERGFLSLQSLLDLVITLCDALAYAHSQGVVHRDIKPSNVQVSSRGELKLLDFGIARLSSAGLQDPEQTNTQFRAVTPTYASPEQIAGEAEVTFRSDIYSVGVLLYVLLTGRPPFQLTGLTTTEMERVLQTSLPVLPSDAARNRFNKTQAAALDAVIGRAMDPRPAQRYESMAALKAELQRLRSNQAPLASPRRYYARRWWRAHQAATKRMVASAAALVVIGAGALWLRHEHKLATQIAAAPKRISLAVVPIGSAASGRTGLAVAIQEALATELASGDQIQVTPATNVAQAMRDLKLTPSARLDAAQRTKLGQLLGVDYLLEERTDAVEDKPGGSGTLRLETSLDRVHGPTHIADQTLETTLAALDATTQQIAVNTARLLPLKRSFSASPSLLPHQAAAVRFYAEGLEHLQALESVPAQASLLQADAVEPGSPLIHIALARDWEMLGYRQRAVDEADKSIGLTTNLPVKTRLAVEAPADEIRHQWPAAAAAYKTLRDYDPDDIEYVLGLARSQLAANQAQEALKTVQAAASMPSLLGADPRIELLGSEIQESLGNHAEALRSADEVYAASRERSATQLMAQAQEARASALESLGKVDEGLAAAHQAEELFSNAGDIKGRGMTLISTGSFLEDHAKYAEAKDAYSQAREIFAKVGDEDRLGVAENDLGIIAMDVGDAEAALQQYTTSLQIFRKVDDLPRVASELNNIGIVQKELGNVEAAKASYAASLELLKQLHDTRQVARAYNNLGILLLQQDKLDDAEHDFQQAYSIYSTEGMAARAILPLDGLAHIAWMRGRLQEAHARYQQAVVASRKIPEPRLLAISLRADAHVLHDAGDEGNARKELKESEDLRQTNHETVALAETKLSGTVFDLDAGRAVEPASRFTDLLDVFTSKKQVEDEVAVHLAWTRSLLLEGKRSEAKAHFRTADTMSRQSKDASLKADMLPVRARLLAAQGEHRKAEAMLDQALAQAQASGNIAAQMELLLVKLEVVDTRSRRSLRQAYVQKATTAGFLRAARQMQEQ